MKKSSEEKSAFVFSAASLFDGDLVKSIVALAVGGSTAWMMMGARVDTAQADTKNLRADFEAEKLDRKETKLIWTQERIDNSAFRSEVMTKLNRIERKLDK